MIFQPKRLSVNRITQLLPLKCLTIISNVNIVKISHYTLISIIAPMYIHPRIKKNCDMIGSARYILTINF